MAEKTPVVFIVFNRPDVTRESFARIRKRRPGRLFIIADGPRLDHPGDAARCAEVREIVERIDWPCEVTRDYSNVNLGLKRRVSTGLDQVFSLVDRAVVLEDDCVAHPDFFKFCDVMLDRYADDSRVATVTGDNFQRGRRRGIGSYYFSRYVQVWGWATWQRAWNHYDVDMAFWPTWRGSKDWKSTIPDPVERRYWQEIFDRTWRDEIDTWDYQWLASTWYHKGLTVTPNVNLVENIGFGSEATHTKGASMSGPTQSIGDVVHPETVWPDVDADRFVFDHQFGGLRLRARRRPIGFVRWFVPGVLRVAKRKLRSMRHT